MNPGPQIVELIAARRRAELTQADVASSLGVSRTSVTNWESGTATPRLETFLRWAAAVGLVVLLVPRASITEQTPTPTG